MFTGTQKGHIFSQKLPGRLQAKRNPFGSKMIDQGNPIYRYEKKHMAKKNDTASVRPKYSNSSLQKYPKMEKKLHPDEEKNCDQNFIPFFGKGGWSPFRFGAGDEKNHRISVPKSWSFGGCFMQSSLEGIDFLNPQV